MARKRRGTRAARDGSLADAGGFLLFGAMTAFNLSNFVFHAMMSRILGPAAYGGLGALLGVLLVLQVPIGAVQVAITHRVASARGEQPDERGFRIARLVSSFVAVGIAAALAVAAVSPWVRHFLHLPSTGPVVLLGLTLAPVLVGIVPKAVLLGEFRFRSVAVALVLGATTRLLLGFYLGNSGRGIAGAMAATAFGETIVALCLLLPLRRSIAVDHDGPELTMGIADAGLATTAFIWYWALANVDTILVRHFLALSESGLYAAASTAAGAVLFLPGAVALIAFPTFARFAQWSPNAKRALKQAVIVVSVLAFGAALVLSLFPRQVLALVFGSQFESAAPILRVLAPTAAVMGLSNVLMHFLIARRSRFAWAALPGLLFATASISLLHSSVTTVAITMLITSVLVLGLLVLGVATTTRQSYLATHRPATDDRLWDIGDPDLDLTVVVPFYNPGPRFRGNIDEIIEILKREQVRFELIAVSDGSTDGSERAIEGMESEGVRCVIQPANAGKGSALRTGLAMGRGCYLGFIDADGDVDPSLLSTFLGIVRLYEPDVVLGSKRHPLSEVDYPAIRRVYSWGYQQVVRILFRLNIRDTQTGLKLIRRDVLARVLPLLVEKRFVFDLELLVVARHLGYRRFFEAPVRLRERFTSTISFRSVRGMFLDTLAIFYRLYLLNWYDRDVSATSSIQTSVATGGSGATSA